MSGRMYELKKTDDFGKQQILKRTPVISRKLYNWEYLGFKKKAAYSGSKLMTFTKIRYIQKDWRR